MGILIRILNMTDVYPSNFNVMDTNPTLSGNIKQSLNAIYNNPVLYSLLSGIGSTTINFKSDAFTSDGTSFARAGLDVSDIIDYSNLTQSEIDIIEQGNFVNVDSSDLNTMHGNSGYFNSTLQGALFHELFHAASIITQPAASLFSGTYYEQIAIFATNISYHKAAGLSERIGHAPGNWNGTETSGYVLQGDASTFSWQDGKALFVTTDQDGVGYVNKKFGNVTTIEGQSVYNYNTIERNTGGVGIVSSGDQKIESILSQSIVSGGSSALLQSHMTAQIAQSIINQYMSSPVSVTTDASRYVSVTNDTVADIFDESLGVSKILYISGPIVGDPVRMSGSINVYGAYAPENFYIDDSSSSIGAYLLGGAQGSQADVLKGGGGGDLISIGSGSGPNKVDAGGGHNFIIGGVFDDEITSGSGNDVIMGSYGADVIDAGSGSNILIYQGFSSGIELNLSTDVNGVSANIHGSKISNVGTIIATQHNDILTGNGSSVLYGGGGSDTFILTSGDKAYGGASSDTFIIRSGAPVISSGGGSDTLKFENDSGHHFSASGGVVTIDGTSYAGIGVIHAGNGNNTINPSSAFGFIGGTGNDTFVVTSYLDTSMKFNGGSGAGIDKLDLSQMQGTPLLTLDMKFGTLEAYGDTFDVSTIEQFDFTGKSFKIYATDDGETIDSFSRPAQWTGEIHGRGGADFINAQDYDVIYGDGGNDFISMANIGRAYGGADNDYMTTTGQAFLYGEAGDDTLKGSDLANALYGGADNDQLFGFGGQDQLYGGTGNNVLNGGEGWDFGFISGSGRGSSGGVMAIYETDPGNWIVVKNAYNSDGSRQFDTLIDVETILFDMDWNGNQDVMNLYSGYTYFHPDFMI